MPKDVDEEIKDLYSDSTTEKKGKSRMTTYEEAAENEESGVKTEKKQEEAPKAHKSFAQPPLWETAPAAPATPAAPAAPALAATPAPVEAAPVSAAAADAQKLKDLAAKQQEAPKPAAQPENTDPFSYSVLTDHLSKK